MLPLDSPRWRELKQAYGSAEGIPKLLASLKTAPPKMNYRSEPWFSLWSSLCHQGDIYTASYAALPHLVADATDRTPSDRLDHFLLIASIEASRHRSSALPIPADLESAYTAAIQQCTSQVLDSLKLDWQEVGQRILLGSLAILKGNSKLGTAIFDFDKELTS